MPGVDFIAFFQSFGWPSTPLGSLDSWPQSLKSVVDLMLASRQPVFVTWGPELTCLYNEAFLPILGLKHPQALGRPYAEVWSEIWTEFRPIVEATLAGEAQYFVDYPIALAGRGEPRESWFTFSYTPLRNKAGKISGFFSAATETTDKMLAERRLRQSEENQAFLLALTDTIAKLTDPVSIQTVAARTLAHHLRASRVGYAEDCGDCIHVKVTRDHVDGVASIAGVYRYSDFGPDLLREFCAGHTVVRRDIPRDASLTDGERAASNTLGVAASVDAPLLVNGRLASVFFVHASAPRAWTPGEVALIESTAHRLSGSLASARAEAALRESESALGRSRARLRHAADAAGLTYSEFDLVQGSVNSAENFARVFGYEPLDAAKGDAMATRMPHFISHIAPGYRQVFADAFQRMAGDGQSQRIEYRVLADDGEERWVESVGSVERTAEGRPTRAFVTHLDITAQVAARRQLAEAKQRAEEILSSIGDAFYALDADWRVVYFNAKAQQILGKPSAEVYGRNLLDIFPANRETEIHSQFRRAMVGREPVEFEAVSPVLQRWVAYSVFPTDGGGISVYYRDIQREKAMQQELVAAKAEAEQSNKAKSKFLAAASHDLRQPVQSLVLLLSMIERQVKELPKAFETAQKMKQALDGLNGLLTSILDISHLDAGVIEPAIEPVDLGALLGRLNAEYAAKARHAGLTYRGRCQKLAAHTDARLLERMLRNLIENAIRYTRKGGVLIGLRPRADRVRIDVVDTGIGIPAARQDEIFEEFSQLHNPGRDLQKGLGLGLAVVARIARLLDAQVEVSSIEGRGSRFSLYLPAAKRVDECFDAADPVVATGGRLLIVEDNWILRESLGAMAQEWGYQVLLAATGEEAIEMARLEAWTIDAIITDFSLGEGIDGLSAGREIARGAGRAIPMLVLTGETAAAQIAQISASGCEIAHKPFNTEDLSRKVALLLRNRTAPAPAPP